MTSLVKRWGPPLFWMAFIFAGSSIPGEDFPQYGGVLDFLVKKSGHVLEYGLLAVLLLRSVSDQGWNSAEAGGETLPARPHVALALLLSTLYAATDEFHQRFTPGRGPRPLDVGIDVVGASLGIALYFGWRIIRQTRTQSPPSHSTRPRP